MVVKLENHSVYFLMSNQQMTKFLYTFEVTVHTPKIYNHSLNGGSDSLGV